MTQPTISPEERQTYVELAKLSQRSIESRRQSEWKVAFGLWSGVAAGTYFFVKEGVPFNFFWIFAAIAYGLFISAWVVFWQTPLRRAFEQDKCYKHHFTKLATGKVDEEPVAVRLRDMWGTKSIDNGIPPLFWTLGQVAVTGLFLVGSVIIIANSHSKKSESPVTIENDTVSVKVSEEGVNVKLLDSTKNAD